MGITESTERDQLTEKISFLRRKSEKSGSKIWDDVLEAKREQDIPKEELDREIGVENSTKTGVGGECLADLLRIRRLVYIHTKRTLSAVSIVTLHGSCTPYCDSHRK